MKFLPTVSIEDRQLLQGRLMDDSYVERVEADPLNGELVVTVVVMSPERAQLRWDAYFKTLNEEVKYRSSVDGELLERLAYLGTMSEEEVRRQFTRILVAGSEPGTDDRALLERMAINSEVQVAKLRREFYGEFPPNGEPVRTAKDAPYMTDQPKTDTST